MSDPIFAHPRLAAIYDPLDPDRSDLDVYAALVDEVGAATIVDVGCGTGAFAVLLAERGKTVIGADPADASIEVARTKPFADRVRWLCCGASDLPELRADAATMTGNVAQVFVGDDEWAAALAGVRRALRPGGAFVFETREPTAQAWTTWTREATYVEHELPGGDLVRNWVDLLDVQLPLVSFRWTFEFAGDGTVLTSDSTLRFRSREEVASSLDAAGFVVRDVRDAPDRPGRELVFVAATP